MKNGSVGERLKPSVLKTETRHRVGGSNPPASAKVLEWANENLEEALYPTDMKEAIIGVVERYGMGPLILLDRTKCIKILMRDGMTWEEAEEFFQFNTIGAWMGEGTPCFATLAKDLET